VNELSAGGIAQRIPRPYSIWFWAGCCRSLDRFLGKSCLAGRACEITIRQRQAFRHLKENPSSWWGSYATRVLKPGESFDEDLVVTHLYKLGQGEYAVQVARGIRGHVDSSAERIKSNVIHLTVSN